MDARGSLSSALSRKFPIQDGPGLRRQTEQKDILLQSPSSAIWFASPVAYRRCAKLAGLSLLRLKVPFGNASSKLSLGFFDHGGGEGGNILEQFSCCRELSTTTAGQRVLDALDAYLTSLGSFCQSHAGDIPCHP